MGAIYRAHPRSHRAPRLRRVRRGRPRPAAAPRADRRDDVGADDDDAAGRAIDAAARRMTSPDVVDVVVIGAGVAGLAAATSLAESGASGPRARRAAAARRPRHGVPRSRDRRARRQRPARDVRLLPRDVRAARRVGARATSIVSQRSRCRISMTRAAARCCAARRAAAAAPAGRGDSAGARCRSAIGSRSCAWRLPLARPGASWLAAETSRRESTRPCPAGCGHRGQGPMLTSWLWEPLAVAALNQSPDEARRSRSSACWRRCSARTARRRRWCCRPAAARDVRGAGAGVHRAARRRGAHQRPGARRGRRRRRSGRRDSRRPRR